MSGRKIFVYKRHLTNVCVFNYQKVYFKHLLLGGNFTPIEKPLFISDVLAMLVSLGRKMVNF